MDNINMANVLMFLSRGHHPVVNGEKEDEEAPTTNNHHHDHRRSHVHEGRVFVCKTCSRQFPSFQALGGHRASHRKPRDGSMPGQKKPGKAHHECSVCGLEFGVGQALGGHMRRHRGDIEKMKKKRGVHDLDHVLLDLNLLPPSDDDDHDDQMEFADNDPSILNIKHS